MAKKSKAKNVDRDDERRRLVEMVDHTYQLILGSCLRDNTQRQLKMPKMEMKNDDDVGTSEWNIFFEKLSN